MTEIVNTRRRAHFIVCKWIVIVLACLAVWTSLIIWLALTWGPGGAILGVFGPPGLVGGYKMYFAVVGDVEIYVRKKKKEPSERERINNPKDLVNEAIIE